MVTNTRPPQCTTYAVVYCATCAGMGNYPLTFSLTPHLLLSKPLWVQGKSACSNTNQAEVVTEEEEELLWEKGLLGDQSLLDTMVYNTPLGSAVDKTPPTLVRAIRKKRGQTK